jgi:hypothetical protein
MIPHQIDIAAALGLPPLKPLDRISGSRVAGLAVDAHPARQGGPVAVAQSFPGGAPVGADAKQRRGLPLDARPAGGSQPPMPTLSAFPGLVRPETAVVANGLPVNAHGAGGQHRDLRGCVDAHPERLEHVLASVHGPAQTIDGGATQIRGGVAVNAYPDRPQNQVGAPPSPAPKVPLPLVLSLADLALLPPLP